MPILLKTRLQAGNQPIFSCLHPTPCTSIMGLQTMYLHFDKPRPKAWKRVVVLIVALLFVGLWLHAGARASSRKAASALPQVGVEPVLGGTLASCCRVSRRWTATRKDVG